VVAAVAVRLFKEMAVPVELSLHLGQALRVMPPLGVTGVAVAAVPLVTRLPKVLLEEPAK
jgi:hypothetical protein